MSDKETKASELIAAGLIESACPRCKKRMKAFLEDVIKEGEDG